MDKREFLGKKSYLMSDGKTISVNVYRKKLRRGSRYGITIRSNYGSMEVYILPWVTEAMLSKWVKEVYETHPERIVDRPYMRENVYIYMLGQKRYFTNDPSLKNNEYYFYIPSTTKDPLTRYKKMFLEYLKPRVVEIGKRMGRDLSDYTIRTGLFLSYYGICFPTKKQFKFDYRLFAFKPEIMDSIIIHEIAHTYEIHHNDRFYKIVKMYCPNYDRLQEYVEAGYFEGKLDNYVI